MLPLLKHFCDPDSWPQPYRPIVGWSLALMAGIALGFQFGHPYFWLIVATACVVHVWRPKARDTFYTPLVLCIALASFCAWRGALTHDRNAIAMARLNELRGETFPIKVTVANDCHVIQRKRGGPYCKFSADDAWFEDGTEIHGTNLLINFYDKRGVDYFPQTGETWILQGKLSRTFYRYRVVLSAQGATAHEIVEESEKGTPQYLMARVRNRLAQHLAYGVSPEDAILTQTMTLGTRQRLPYELRTLYANAGIIHIFAISGLHVGIIAGIVIWVIAWSGLYIRMRWAMLIPILIAYLFITGFPPSATRACIMAMIYCFAPAILDRPDAPSAFFITAALVFIISPGWIVNAGAVMSFSVMGGILLFISPINYFINRLLHSNSQRNIEGELPKEPPFHLRFRQFFAAMMALSISAWISALPFSLCFFGQVSIVGLILNIFVPALAGIVVWNCCISVIIGFVWLPLSSVVNRANAFILDCVTNAAKFLTGYDWAVYRLDDSTSVTFTLLFEIGLVFLAIALRSMERKCRLADPRDPQNLIIKLPELIER